MKLKMSGLVFLFLAGYSLAAPGENADMKTNEVKEYRFHIAPHGNDKWEGTKDKPFASLSRGLEAARGISEDKARKHLVIGAGRYFEVNLALTARDSGLTIEAEPGKDVFLHGGRRVTGWRKEGDKFWSAAIPGVREGKLDFRAFVVNGRLAPRARYPKKDHLIHLNEFKVSWLSTTAGGWERPPTRKELTTMKYDPKDIGKWLELKNAEINIFHIWDESLVGVAAMDSEKITFSSPAGHPPGAFGVNKYVVWNIREGMTGPGQWFLDRVNGRVVYWPLASENMDKIEAIIPTTENIVRCEGTAGTPVKDVTFRGMNFSVANTPLVSGGFGALKFPGALSMNSAKNCRVQDCSFSAAAGQAIKITGSTGITVENCLFDDIGAGCICLSKTGKSVISQNHIKNVGKIYPSGIGIFVNGSPGNLIQNNRIENTTYTAIACSGDDNVIEGNLISNYMQALRDGAAIYVSFCKKVIVRGNIVIDDSDSEAHGRHAYYIDEQGENCLLEKNIAFNSPWPLHCHMARNNKVRNNMFFSKGEIRMTFPRCSGFVMEKNIVCSGSSITIFTAAEDTLAAMPDNIFFSARGSIREEIYGPPPDKFYSVQTKTAFKPKDGTLVADPLFMDPDGGNFAFKPGSPALKLGIEPLIMSNRRMD